MATKQEQAKAQLLQMMKNISNSSSALGSGIYLDRFDNSTNVKKIEVYDSTEDVLALSCAWQRNRAYSQASIASMRDDTLYKLVKEEDRTRANEIRTYYQRKIMMWKLAGKELSKFRLDLERFVQESGYRYLESDTGMAYYLPEFYDYDMSLDAIRDEHYDATEELTRPKTPTEWINVKFVRVLTKNRKHYKGKVFWFKLQDRGVLFRLSVRIDNPLLNAFEYLVKSNENIRLSCVYAPNEAEGFKYQHISKLEFVKF